MKKETRKIICNSRNAENNHLQNYPLGSRKDTLSGINMKMYDFMRQCNSEYDSYVAINYLGQRFTYTEVFAEIERYARALKAYGIKKGEYISVMLPNMPELIYIIFAINRVGAVANLIDPRNNPNTVLEYVNNANSKILFTILDKYRSTVEPIIDRICVEKVFSVSPLESVSGKKVLKQLDLICGMGKILYYTKKIRLTYREKIRKTGKYFDISDLLTLEAGFTGSVDTAYASFEAAAVLYTSGTTGGMKGAVITNEAYNSLYKNLQYGVKKQRPGERFCGIIPYFTSYGSGAGMFNCMCVRAEQWLYPNFKPNDFVKIIEKDKPNAIMAVPRFYESLMKENTDISEVELVIIGGDKISPSKLREMKAFFKEKDVIVGYGETEFLGVISVTIDEKYRTNVDGILMGGETRSDSSGIPLPGVTIKIVNPETMEELPYMESGEAYINSASMMLGYLNKDDETEKIVAYDEAGNKYYGTGDKMYLTPDGQICFVDRYKRLIKRPDGHQVNPSTIETMIECLPEIESCCVVGLRYKNLCGVIPTAFIVLKDKEGDKLECVKKMEEESVKELPSYREKALAYVFVNEMPMSKMGKVDYLSLSQLKLEEIDAAYIVDNTFTDKD